MTVPSVEIEFNVCLYFKLKIESKIYFTCFKGESLRKMDTVARNKTLMQPKPMAELLPELGGIASLKDSMQTLTGCKRKPRPTMALTRTEVKSVKPLTIAEMRAEILALKAQSPRRFAQPTTSAKKRTWNSSVKLENKTMSRTSQGQLRNNPVRKGLNFQPKPMVPITPETPKFPKPEFRAKKAIHVQAKSSVRISGVYNISETPLVKSIPVKNPMTLTNKENYSHHANLNSKPQGIPILNKKQTLICPVPDTPLANMSWKSGSDMSFLQREQEAQDIEEKSSPTYQAQIMEKISQATPPASTPFKEYRNVQDFFHQSKESDNSALYHDNTIMCFDDVKCKENTKMEDNVIGNLCDLLNKASVVNVEEPKTELDDLLEVEKQLEHNIKMVENGIKMLTNIKDSQLKSLSHVKKVLKEKKSQNPTMNQNNTLIKAKSIPEIRYEKLNELSPITSKPCSLSKTKSLSYKIPKKSPCLRKKIMYKSVPNFSERNLTPNKDMNKRALDIYMEMKMNQQMNFLNTPCVKHDASKVPDTPAVTSRNLQMQLDKIYQDNT